MYYPCELCETNSKTKSNLTRHLNSKKHLSNLEAKKTKELERYCIYDCGWTNPRFWCEMCDFTTKSINKIKNHVDLPYHDEELKEFDKKQAAEYLKELSELGYDYFEVRQDHCGRLYGTVF